MRNAPDVIQRRRTGRQECFACEHRKDREGAEDEPAEAVRKSLSRLTTELECLGCLSFFLGRLAALSLADLPCRQFALAALFVILEQARQHGAEWAYSEKKY